MWKSKRVKELEAQVEQLSDKLLEFESLKQLSLDNRNFLAEIKNKIEPKPSVITHVTNDAILFARKLTSFRKRKVCGGRGCNMYYEIPSIEIDKIAKQEIKNSEL